MSHLTICVCGFRAAGSSKQETVEAWTAHRHEVGNFYLPGHTMAWSGPEKDVPEQHRYTYPINLQLQELLQDLLTAYDKDQGDGRPLFVVPGDDRSDDLKCDFWSLAGRIRNTMGRLGMPEKREETR